MPGNVHDTKYLVYIKITEYIQKFKSFLYYLSCTISIVLAQSETYSQNLHHRYEKNVKHP